jgi:hypothetical protein
VVLFSAAIPGQGGFNHINEQPLSVWVREFVANHYRPLDVIRNRIWDDEEIPFWYRQNLILFFAEELWNEAASRVTALLPREDTAGVDIVHPNLARTYLGEIESLRSALEIAQSTMAAIEQQASDPETEIKQPVSSRPPLDPIQIGVRARVRLAAGLPRACVHSARRRWKRRRSRKWER